MELGSKRSLRREFLGAVALVIIYSDMQMGRLATTPRCTASEKIFPFFSHLRSKHFMCVCVCVFVLVRVCVSLCISVWGFFVMQITLALMRFFYFPLSDTKLSRFVFGRLISINN